VRSITFYVMTERHGGEKPWFLPYGERAEAPREFFTAGRQRDSAGEASEGPEGVFTPILRTSVGASPPAQLYYKKSHKNSNGPCSSKVRRCA
jgi:hypothetical protein